MLLSFIVSNNSSSSDFPHLFLFVPIISMHTNDGNSIAHVSGYRGLPFVDTSAGAPQDSKVTPEGSTFSMVVLHSRILGWTAADYSLKYANFFDVFPFNMIFPDWQNEVTYESQGVMCDNYIGDLNRRQCLSQINCPGYIVHIGPLHIFWLATRTKSVTFKSRDLCNCGNEVRGSSVLMHVVFYDHRAKTILFLRGDLIPAIGFRFSRSVLQTVSSIAGQELFQPSKKWCFSENT